MYTVDGTYTSSWDDGYCDVTSDVVVDMDAMEIVSWGEREVCCEDGCDVEDMELDILDDEYVEINGTRYTAMNKQEYDTEVAAYGEDEVDKYGNGVITYDYADGIV